MSRLSFTSSIKKFIFCITDYISMNNGENLPINHVLVHLRLQGEEPEHIEQASDGLAIPSHKLPFIPALPLSALNTTPSSNLAHLWACDKSRSVISRSEVRNYGQYSQLIEQSENGQVGAHIKSHLGSVIGGANLASSPLPGTSAVFYHVYCLSRAKLVPWTCWNKKKISKG